MFYTIILYYPIFESKGNIQIVEIFGSVAAVPWKKINNNVVL